MVFVGFVWVFLVGFCFVCVLLVYLEIFQKKAHISKLSSQERKV